MIQNIEEKTQIETIHVWKKESKYKKQKYVNDVASWKAEHLQKKTEKKTQKTAQCAQLTQLIADNS